MPSTDDPWGNGGNGFLSVVDDTGKPTMVDHGGVRYFTEEEPGAWAIGVTCANWAAWRKIAEQILGTPDPTDRSG